MASTYEKIATNTLGSAASSFSFTSIPSTYTDLVLVVSALGAAAVDYIKVNINSDTGSNYSNTALWGDGTSAFSGRVSSQTFGYLIYTPSFSTTSPNALIVNLQNYSNATTYKTYLSRNNTQVASSGPDAIVGLWRSTSAITSLTIARTGGGNFNTGSIITIYGIKAA